MDVVILDEGDFLPDNRKKASIYVPMLQLIYIEDEEERDRIQINLWMQKYNKLFKTLFNKYANTIRDIVDRDFDFKD